MLDKSDDLLGEEMDRTQTLTDDLKRLQTKFGKLQSRQETLLANHEKLSYEFLQRKQDLEKLRVSYDYLQKENDSLLAQQISSAQEEFVPHALNALNVNLPILHLKVQMLLLLQILQLSLWSQIPHLRIPQVSLTMQG